MPIWLPRFSSHSLMMLPMYSSGVSTLARMIGSRISSTWFTGGSLAGLSMLMIEPSVLSTS